MAASAQGHNSSLQRLNHVEKMIVRVLELAGTVMDELAGPSGPRKDAIAGHCLEFMQSIKVSPSPVQPLLPGQNPAEFAWRLQHASSSCGDPINGTAQLDRKSCQVPCFRLYHHHGPFPLIRALFICLSLLIKSFMVSNEEGGVEFFLKKRKIRPSNSKPVVNGLLGSSPSSQQLEKLMPSFSIPALAWLLLSVPGCLMQEIQSNLREEIKGVCEYRPFEMCDYNARIANEICCQKLDYVIRQLDGMRQNLDQCKDPPGL